MTHDLGTVTGVVVPGDGRGRVLGFPTANLAVDADELPPDGIYAAWVRVESGARIGASVSIGSNPTFAGERARRIEVHLHDVELDLYGRRVEVALVRRLRETLRFACVEELIAQTHRDIAASRRALSEHGVRGREGPSAAPARRLSAIADGGEPLVEPGMPGDCDGRRDLAVREESGVARESRPTRVGARTASGSSEHPERVRASRDPGADRDRRGTVAVVGSANLDIVVRVERPPAVGETLLGTAGGRFPGGKGLNQATTAARSGANVRFCAAIGDDDAGAQLTRALVAAGVSVDHVRVVDQPTGIAHVLSYPDGDNSIAVAAGANGALTAADAAAAVREATVVLAQLEVPSATVRSALSAADHAVRILNAAPARADACELLDVVDILVVNETECESLGGIDTLDAAGITVIVTLGGAGARVYPRDAEAFHVPAFDIEPVDTTGAGDAFCGALAASLARGLDVEAAVRRANAAGAIAACCVGAAAYRISAAALDDAVASGVIRV